MQRFVSISFCLLFLASTMGFAVATHYCHGFAVKTSIVLHGDLEPCGDGCITMNGCCENDMDYFKVQDDYVPPAHTGETSHCLLLCLLPQAPVAMATPAGKVTGWYLRYKPPSYSYDRVLLFRSLLI